MSYASAKRDHAIASEVNENRALQCCAHGCPHLWSVEAGSGRLCSAHAWSSPEQWPGITQRLLDAEDDMARFGGPQHPRKPARTLSAEERREIGQRLRQALRNTGGKDWAHRLRKREEQGSSLSDVQRAIWRAALGMSPRLPQHHTADSEAAA